MTDQAVQVDYTQTVNELANRLRVLESKQTLFAERLLTMNQNMIEEYKKLVKDIRSSRDEVGLLKKDLDNVKNVVKHLTEEAGKFAKQDDVRTLQKYVNYWNPMKFMTEKEVIDLIKKAMHKKNMPEIDLVEDEMIETSIEDIFSLSKEERNGK
ncbi:MAG: hypothetical protein Q8Q35_02320 [Nanoarchaeota archaeon]|nr:hypothetical protein [Nanoarchaeota archaeon]